MTSEARVVELELEILKKNCEYEVLEAKFRGLEAEKLAIEEQLKGLKRENDELKEGVAGVRDETKEGCKIEKGIKVFVDLTEGGSDEDVVTQLMIENKVLECEKQRAESKVTALEKRFEQLELWVLHSQKNLVPENTMRKDEAVTADVGSISQFPGSASNCTPYKHGRIEGGTKGVGLESEPNCQLVRSQLVFQQEKSPSKKMAPSTPGGAKPPHSVVNISDSEDELHDTDIQFPSDIEGGGKIKTQMACALGGTVAIEKVMTAEISLKQTNCDQSNVEDVVACETNFPRASTPKRKRASNVVSSDSESDDDDNLPISRLKKMRIREIGPDQVGSNKNGIAETATAPVVDNVRGTVTPTRRRLLPQRKCIGKDRYKRKPQSDTSETKGQRGISTNADTEDDDSNEVDSDSEGESLGGFIVNTTEDSGGDDASTESEDSDDIDFSEILANLQRKKDIKYKWEYEADMLADFGKDTELCMKAVCALYRQQTSEEKMSKETLCQNNRGFSKFDALRGTTLAEFLTNGDPLGDLGRTVKELEEHDPKAVKLCRSLANNYSKQLFAIYNNKEDPLFLP